MRLVHRDHVRQGQFIRLAPVIRHHTPFEIQVDVLLNDIGPHQTGQPGTQSRADFPLRCGKAGVTDH